MMRLTTTKYGECFSNITAKTLIKLIAIIIGIATLYQKYQLAFTFQSDRQFLYTDKTVRISNSSIATEATVDDKIKSKPLKIPQSKSNHSENEKNDELSGKENSINKTTTVVIDVPSEKDVILFDRNSKYQNCWLSSDINILGCGMDGHAFLATMNCPHPVTNTSINQYDVVLKIPIAFNDTEEGKQRIYISETDSSLKSMVELHHLVMDNTTTKIRQRFALPIGTATFQKNLLLKEVYTNKKSSERCMEIIPKSSSTTTTNTTRNTINTINTFTTNDETVLGTIMEYGGSNKLDPGKLTDPDDRRRVVKDLVCMYHHMYRVSENEWIGNAIKYQLKSCSISNYRCCCSSSSKRKFVHQDISFFHFHDNGNHTSMIDFNRVSILRGWNKSDDYILQQVQQFQLMTLISNVCSQNYGKYKIMNRVKVSLLDEYTDTQLMSNMTSELKQCEFNTIKSSSNIVLFGDNITTSETYQTLLDILDEKCQ